MEALEKLVPNVVKREIATLIDGQIRHESKKVASWLIQYMESTAGNEKDVINWERRGIMSFASRTKKELTQMEGEDCCTRSEVAAFIRMNGAVSFSNKQLSLDVQTENAAIARRLYSNLRRLYPYKMELLVRKKMRLKKNNVYICRIRDGAKPLLKDLLILTGTFEFKNEISQELVKNNCCKRAYLTRCIFGRRFGK